VLVLALSCAGDPEIPDAEVIVEEASPQDTAEPEDIETLDALPALTRLSLDLRGTRPSLSEIERVQADPAALDTLREEFLQDPAMPDRMGWIWNDAVHTAVWGQSYVRFGELEPATWAAIGWEPLALVAAITDEDRPFTDLVTAEETRANPALADFYGLDGGSADWGSATYTDDRPTAGILSTNGLWLRYTADQVNFNRTRANAVADLFLCADFLDRDGGFEFALDPEDLTSVEEAVRTEPACLSCHAALDPMTGFFGGFAEKSDELPEDQYLRYSTFFEVAVATNTPPAYYGTSASDLHDLGNLIAADPRFTRCAVRRFYEGLVGEAPSVVEERRLLSDWKVEGLVVRALVRDITTSDAYLQAEPRPMRAEVLYTSTADLMGRTIDVDPDEGLAPMGYDATLRVLAGGSDDDAVLVPNEGPHLGAQAVMAWASRMTRDSVADVLEVDPDTDDSAAIRAELARLHLRFFGLVATEDDLDALQELHAAGGFDLVVAGLLRHPRMLAY